MPSSMDRVRSERVDAVLELAFQRVPPAQKDSIDVFAREYFAQVDPEDLEARSPQDLLGAMLSHWQFGATRSPGGARVRVLSPTVAATGWESRHSVIDIVNDDMPFLVDTVTMEIDRQGLTLHLIVHPIVAVERDERGQLLAVHPREPLSTTVPQAPGAPLESWIHAEVDRLIDPQQRADLVAGIERVLADVRVAVTDWKPMVGRLHEVIHELEHLPPSISAGQAEETRAFVQWLADDHLTLLGYRQHDLVIDNGQDALRPVPGTGLGLLRERDSPSLSDSFQALPPKARAFARAPTPLVVVTKANTRSTVHRPGYTDYIGVKRYNAAGEVIGEHRFIGLFTSSAYSARVANIPLLRRKTEAIAHRAGLAPGGHLAKALHHILETYPRDDLFQMPDDALYDAALGILALGERKRVRLFVWSDPFDRFVSCLVYVLREAYSTDLRIKFQRILMTAFAGTRADFDVQLSDSRLARIHFTVRTTPGQVPEVDHLGVQNKLASAARRWVDELRDALIDSNGEAGGISLFNRWSTTFPLAYRDRNSARDAVPDVHRLNSLTADAPLALSLYRPLGAAHGTLGFKLYRLGDPVVLSDSLPMLEHLGVRVLSEQNYQLDVSRDANVAALSLHDFELLADFSETIDPAQLAGLFEDTFAKVFRGEIENDNFNRLVLLAGLEADEIVVLRAYAKYLKQIGFAATQATIESTLTTHPHIARMLVRLFKLRLEPAGRDEQGATAQVNAIDQALARVTNLSEDRVLRQFLALVLATLRTNFWRTGVGHSEGLDALARRRSFLSFKFDSALVPGLPKPRPLFEIWVYSPRFEGIHLRGGKVARGGLRWSDRPDDFRTEVLGLVKAQKVKNTVIVPVGSKGGFVLKKAPPASDREAFMKEGVACYQDYLRGLLDLTDNLVAGAVVPPPQVVRLDGDDPYLVVAADKGTATFSDYANAISDEYGHWLGDAFASGGSVGYDHKAMGITARGAWESVKRHFREMGVDTQRTEFTVVGIGDMSGDVFGNGMLLSPHIRLVAAFDHRHIFIDPTPNAATSFTERERLFKLPRSSWADCDTTLISEGGGIWSRSEKSIPLSPQARAALHIDAQRLTPAELVTAILKAPVDLLYNGGIGTYVKASTETHAEVGDRANDGLRVNGAELRCKVVCEGGNLGFTQRGRVEAALAGVRLNTDAIDNSAGVDTSDHEVNIKILLGLALSDGELTEKQRNSLLPQLADDVAALVLRDNYFQTQALSVTARLGVSFIDQQARFIRFLEKRGQLDRAIEYLPDDEEITARQARGIGLTRPELAVLLAYSKMWLSDELMNSDLPEDPWIGAALERYFPQLLREKFAAYIPSHPLKREITAAYVLNSMVNRVGATFVYRLTETTGATPSQVVRAYLATREVFSFVPLWRQIEALDNQIDDSVQGAMLIVVGDLTARATTWFLRSNRLNEPMAQRLERFKPVVDLLRVQLEPVVMASERFNAWVQAGVPAQVAQQVDSADGLFSALDIAEVAAATQRAVGDVAQVWFDVSALLPLDRLHQQVNALPSATYWDSLARMALGDDLADVRRLIAEAVVRASGCDNAGIGGSSTDSSTSRLSAWQTRCHHPIHRAQRLLAELAESKNPDLAMLSVALRELRNLG